jgi:pSer/pThr/pTyr-binding forkhead associated (FHA) protein
VSETAGLRLVVRGGPDSGRSIVVTRGGVVVGREVHGPGNFPDDDELSRTHARFVSVHGGGLLLEDLGSTNGTYVNGEAIDAPRIVHAGDRITVGGTVLELVGEPAPRPEKARAAAASGGVAVGGSVEAREGSIGVIGQARDIDLSRRTEVDMSGMRFISETRGLARFLMFAGVFVAIAGIGLFGYPIVRELSTAFDSGPSCTPSDPGFPECIEQGFGQNQGPDVTPWLPLGMGLAFLGIVIGLIGFALARSSTRQSGQTAARRARFR